MASTSVSLAATGRKITLIAVAIAISNVVYGADRVSFGILVPHVLRAFTLSSSVSAGTAATTFLLGQALVLLPAGWLCDRWGPKRVMVFGMVFFSIAVLVSGLSQSFSQLVIYRLFTGVGEGFFLSAAVIVGGAVFSKNRGAAIGLLDASFAVGLMIGPMLTASLITQGTSGWRSPLIIFGIAGVVLGALVYLLMDDGLITERLIAIHNSREKGTGTRTSSAPHFISATVMYIAWGLAFWPFIGLAPTYLIKVEHFPVSVAAAAATAGGLGVFLLSVPFGMLADRLGRLPVIAVSAAIAAAANWVLFHTSQSGLSAAILFFIVESACIGSLFTNLTAYAQDTAPQRHFGAAIGFVYMLVYLIAAFSGPVLGSIVDRVGWLWGTNLVLVLPLAGIAVVAFGMIFAPPAGKYHDA